jgi:hypothetical protein
MHKGVFLNAQAIMHKLQAQALMHKGAFWMLSSGFVSTGGDGEMYIVMNNQKNK